LDCRQNIRTVVLSALSKDGPPLPMMPLFPEAFASRSIVGREWLCPLQTDSTAYSEDVGVIAASAQVEASRPAVGICSVWCAISYQRERMVKGVNVCSLCLQVGYCPQVIPLLHRELGLSPCS